MNKEELSLFAIGVGVGLFVGAMGTGFIIEYVIFEDLPNQIEHNETYCKIHSPDECFRIENGKYVGLK